MSLPALPTFTAADRVATYRKYLSDTLIAGNVPIGWDFSRNEDVSERLRVLIKDSIGWNMHVEVHAGRQGGKLRETVSEGVDVLDKLQKYSQPRAGEGCGAWFDYAVNNVGHVFRSFLNLITFGTFSSYINSEWTDLEEAVAAKFAAAATTAINTARYPLDNTRLQFGARHFARKILLECLDEYAHPTLEQGFRRGIHSQDAFVERALENFRPK